MLESPQLRAPGTTPGGSFSIGGAPSLATKPSLPVPAPTKSLAALLSSVPDAKVRGQDSVSIEGLAYRSTDVRPGTLFFCVPGTRLDGHDFAGEAWAAGAPALVVERWLGHDCAQVLVPSVRRAMGPMAAAFYDHPSLELTVVGVTGTNGKTTTTYLLESIFRAAGMVSAVVGTTGVRLGGRAIPFDRTTPEAPDLQGLLALMLREGVGAVALEASSHGLHQHRIDGTRHRCAVFTNLSQDHLDYHGSLEEYFDAKARLFSPELSDQAVVNGDSPEGRMLAARPRIPTVTFGLRPGSNLMAEDVRASTSGLSFTVEGLPVRSHLRGTFNLYNCLGAFAAAREVGIDDAAIVKGIDGVLGVPGRLEPVQAGQPFQVLVDYAHTPDSLENVLRAVRGITGDRVITVFGCGGDRDRGKRPLMGEVATRLSDLTVLTSDNPRTEEPEAIIAEIETGARRGGGTFLVEVDRRLAIRSALEEAGPPDVVVIAGKGHETGQEFRDRTIPFDDRVVAREEISALRGQADR
jgi:UDP-N-acetylmuramoyl-L-alanyl-D-glutamate--2,6-diaminopimelate ligase